MAGLMAVASHLYGVKAGYRLLKPWLARGRTVLNLEACVLGGLAMIVSAIAAMAAIAMQWGAGSFAALPSILPVAVAGVVGTIGLQTLFGGFLLAVIGGNEAAFAIGGPE
jgi:hypothetical protein